MTVDLSHSIEDLDSGSSPEGEAIRDDASPAGARTRGQTPGAEPAAVVARLREQSSRILANWVVRTANLPAFRATPRIELNRLQDRIPTLLNAIFVALASSGASVDPLLLGEATQLANEHGRVRAEAHFGAGVVLAEYQQLRDELWRALWRIVDADPGMPAAPRLLQARLDMIFDSLGIHAIEGWADVRLSRGPSSQAVQPD
jgi:hypothetical protein